MIQTVLDFNDYSGIVCANGQPDARYTGYSGPHHCAACAAEVEAMCAAFHAAVARGEYDTEGYTPAERRAANRRAMERGTR